MFISLSTILNTTIWTSLLILLLLILFHRPAYLIHLSLPTLITAGMLLLLRLLMPFEFFFTLSIPIGKILPDIYMALRTPLLQLGDHTLLFFHILFAIWMLGSTVLLFRTVHAYRRLRRHLHRLPPVTDNTTLEIFNEVNASFQKPASFSLVTSAEATTAYIAGFFHPVIILPDTEWDTKQLRYILSHELHHYYRRHPWIKLLCECACILYFWNPLIHILSRQLCNLLELDVDKAATDSYSVHERLAYTECLLAVSRLQQEASTGKLLGFSFTTAQTSGLQQRVQYLLHPPETKWTRVHSAIFYGILCICIALSLFFICEAFVEPTETVLEINSENTYFIKQEDGTYDLYYNDEYIISVTEIFDPAIPIKEELQ